MQNSSYVAALEEGKAAAASKLQVLDAVLAIIRPIVECNRVHVDNGRSYLRELVFGDPEEPHHRDALVLTLQTEQEVAAILRRDGRISSEDAATLAQTVSAVVFLSMAATINADRTVDDIIAEVANRLRVILPR